MATLTGELDHASEAGRGELDTARASVRLAPVVLAGAQARGYGRCRANSIRNN
jgi:hypothetical protein